jgi:acetylornithine deacetylase/succinyl-diaminopimelate desuccinylase-like protein
MLDQKQLQDSAVELLQMLIRFRTVNPPGDERPAQEFIAKLLSEAGFEVELLAKDPARPNLIARLAGAADGPVLAYLGHIDTVLADPDEWELDPWSGELHDGCVWGRGAQDMKGTVAAELAAAVALAESGWRPAAGELKIVITADEEAGGNFGARWLCEEHPDKVRCDYAINEGGGQMFEYDGRRFYRVCCAEKGFCRFDIVTHGTAGHASIPRMGDNALLKQAGLLQRLAESQPAYDLTEEPQAMLRALLGQEPDERTLGEALAVIESKDPRLAVLVEPTLGVTLTPTMSRASEKVNVIPARAMTRVDCRVPPGYGLEHAERRAREVLGDGEYELDFREHAVGNRSAHASPLMDAITEWLSEVDPQATPVPTVLPGFTDSRWFRDAFPDCVAYGFFPQRSMDMYETEPLIHGKDERIPVEDLGLAAAFYARLPQVLLV